MRLNKLKYIVEEDHALAGPTNLAPWITLNGKNIGDSQAIVELLAEQFNIELYKGMTEEEKVISKLFKSLIEEKLIPCLANERFRIFKWDNFKDITQHLFPPMLRPFTGLLWHVQGKKIGKQTGLGKLNKDQLAQKSHENLLLLSKYLGNKKFFFGENLTLLDIIVFGYTTQVLHMQPYSSLIKIRMECVENIVNHNKMMKELAFPDWNSILYKD